jgi:bifunctional DNA-binding transcriptional regulator/antitoxin component of YhaV-PrlF toxin-antitoxin module
MSVKDKKTTRCHVSPTGRISLPADFRKAVGLERGGDVVVELDGRDIRIRTIQESIARAQAVARRLFADKPNVSSDDFLSRRREDWGQE